jgi:hypothetical protein
VVLSEPLLKLLAVALPPLVDKKTHGQNNLPSFHRWNSCQEEPQYTLETMSTLKNVSWNCYQGMSTYIGTFLMPVRQDYYKDTLMLEHTSAVLDISGKTLILFMNGILPPQLIENLEEVAEKMGKIVKGRVQKTDVGNVIRGSHNAVRFGSIIERGGSGKICISKDNEKLADIINKNTVLWNMIAIIFTITCPNEAKILLTVPESLRIFGGMFTAAYWNLEPAYRLHRDTRDWRWCCAIVFGGFKKGVLDFPVINVTIGLQRYDLCFFWSKKLLHTVLHSEETRQSIILTNHTAVIQRFNINVLNVTYDHK